MYSIKDYQPAKIYLQADKPFDSSGISQDS